MFHIKYPHEQGPTRLSYSSNGQYLLTTGKNGLLRRFAVGTEDEPDTLELPANGLTVSCDDSKIVVGCENGNAYLWDMGFKEGAESLGILARATQPIRFVDLSHDGKWASICGDDCMSIVNVNDVTDVRELPSHPKTIRTISWGPNNSTVATSALDGIVRFFDLEGGKLVHLLEGILPRVKESSDLRTTRAAFGPPGFVAVPTKTFGVAVYSTQTWLPEFRLEGEHEGPLTDFQWSPNGRYIATAAQDGRVLLWDVASGTVINKLTVNKCDQLCWHPVINELSVSTNKGGLLSVPDWVPSSAPPPFGTVVNLLPGLDNTGYGREAGGEESEEDLFLSDDDDAATSPPVYEHPAKRAKPDHYAQQSSVLQPGSTPWVHQRRYLCINLVGYVWVLANSPDENSVTIKFFDESDMRELHFTDSECFDLAALSSQGCLFGSSRTGKVVMRFHAGLADNWEYQVPPGDELRAIALSDQVAVICTANGYVRCMSIYGSHLQVSRQSRDPVVSCAADGQMVIVVRSSGGGKLSYSLENAISGEFIQRNDAVDVAPSKQLHALFFSEDGDPCAMDSDMTLSVLIHSRIPGQARWVPIFTADEGQYWPLAIYEGKLSAVSVGSHNRYPPIPLPDPQEYPLAVPGAAGHDGEYLTKLVQSNMLKDKLESLGNDGETEDTLEECLVELDRIMLRRFQLACQDRRVNRALSLSSLMGESESLQAAAKIALHYQLTSLAEKITDNIST